MNTNRQLFLQHLGQTSPEPMMLEPVRAHGCRITDAQGKEYLDLIAGISVSNVGHSHPEVLAAVKQQVDAYMHVMVYGEFIESPQVQYATWLAAQLPGALDSVFFVNSGSEAVEGAIKLAKRITGRTGLVACGNAYHGATHGALSLGGDESRKQAFRPLLPDVKSIPFNDFAALEQITCRTAAFIVEPVQGEAGVVPPVQGYLQAVRERCNATGTILIFDECQTGFGRTGQMFASITYGVTPDIVTMGKALGGGMPLGAFAAAREHMSAFTHQPVLGHITTFGGHPVCCAAGLAAARIITPELLQHVREMEQLFLQLLQHPRIREVRSAGLLMAVHLESEAINKALIQQLLQQGIITDWFLFAADCLRIAPPLVIAESEVRYACHTILQALESVTVEN